MNLPISWVVAGAIPASQAAKQVVEVAATSASHFFGELLQTRPSAADNGRLVQDEQTQTQKTSSKEKSLSDRVESIRSYLSKIVKGTRTLHSWPTGASQTEGLSISANGNGQVQVSGPEPIRSELENHVREHPAIIKEINELAMQSGRSGPLDLLPQHALGTSNEPWTLWLDG